MKIEYLRASRYGNGALVAEEFSKQLVAKGVTVDVHLITAVSPEELPSAGLYLSARPGAWASPSAGCAGS